MVDKNWLKKNTEKLDKIEGNKDKTYDLFVEVCDALVEEHTDWCKTKEFSELELMCHDILVRKLKVKPDYILFVMNHFNNIGVVDYRLFKSGLALPSMVKALKLYLIFYKEYRGTLFELDRVSDFLALDMQITSKNNKDTWDDVLRSLFNSDLDKAYELLFPQETNQEHAWILV